MSLKLTPKALKYIAEKGNSVTVSLDRQVCYSWGGAQSRDIPSVRWGIPEPLEINEYQTMTVDGAAIYVHRSVRTTASARIDLVTGGVGTKLILLGFIGDK